MTYESEVLFKLMERDGFNIPSSVPPYEAEIKAYLINQVKNAYPKLTDYEAEWLLYNYTKHLPADFPISSVTNVTNASFENVVPFAYQSAILKGNTGYRDIDTGEFLETFEEGRNLELVSVKMPVLTTTGKNLAYLEQGYINTENGNNASRENTIRTNYIPIDPQLRYTIYGLNKDASCFLAFYDCNKNFISRTSGSKRENMVIIPTETPTNARYVRLTNYGTEENPVTLDTPIMIEQGYPTSYEPYKSNILTVNEEVELRGIGDVQDTLDCLTGEVTKRIGEVVLDGSENWEIITNPNNLLRFVCLDELKYSNYNEICDKMPTGKSYWGIDENGLYIGNNNRVVIAFNSNDSRYGYSLIEFKNWLSQNPITVQYRLATESIKTVDLKTINENDESVYFMPLEGTMHVSCHSQTIQPTFDMSVPVEATTQNLASFIDLEMEE